MTSSKYTKAADLAMIYNTINTANVCGHRAWIFENSTLDTIERGYGVRGITMSRGTTT
jgi:hypothetical protein